MRRRLKNSCMFQGDFLDADIHELYFWQHSLHDSWPLYPFAAEESMRHQAVRFQEQFCRYLILVFITDGKLRYRIENKDMDLNKGDALLIPPGSNYSFMTQENAFYHKKVLEIKGVNLLSILETFGLNRFEVFHLKERSAWFLERLDSIFGIIKRNNTTEFSELMGQTYMLLNEFSMRKKKKKNTAFRLLTAIQTRLENQLDEPLSIKGLAREFRLSQTQLEHLFRKKFGTSPKEYRILCKIEQAKYLLYHTELTMKEIAFQTGYCNQFYFSQEFKRITGKAPSLFRRSVSA